VKGISVHQQLEVKKRKSSEDKALQKN